MIENYPLYLEQRLSHLWWERQSTIASTEMTQMSGLSDKNFKEAIIKYFSQSLLKNKRIEISQQISRSYKRKQSRNYINKKYNNIKKSLDMLISRVEMTQDRNQ